MEVAVHGDVALYGGKYGGSLEGEVIGFNAQTARACMDEVGVPGNSQVVGEAVEGCDDPGMDDGVIGAGA